MKYQIAPEITINWSQTAAKHEIQLQQTKITEKTTKNNKTVTFHSSISFGKRFSTKPET